MQTSPFLPSHPKVSHQCYKLTGRENYKLTNSKFPKENTPSEQQQGTESGGGGEVAGGKKKSHSYTLNTWQAKGLMQPQPSSLAGPRQLSILRTLPYDVFSPKYWLYSSHRRFSHFQVELQKGSWQCDPATRVSADTCIPCVTSTCTFFPALLYISTHKL